MKILLLGKDGNVGHELQRTLLPLGQVIALSRQDADFEDHAALQRVLSENAPDTIVNAAAFTSVDDAETKRDSAFNVNAYAVGLLADYAKIHNSLLVHYSTDYIFDGIKAGPYLESDTPNPLSVYGETKLAGENAIKKSSCEALILRISWIFSAHGANFVRTILRLARERDSLNIVDDQFGAPTSAELVADVTAMAIATYRRKQLPSGTYNLSASGETTWYGLACHIVDRAIQNGFKLRLNTTTIRPITTEEYPVRAKRPHNSRLNTEALSTAVGLQLPDWKVHANRAIDQLTSMDL